MLRQAQLERIFVRLTLLLLAAFWSAAASAGVTLTFHSRELGERFPHAFVRVTGATDAAPDTPLDANYGFTATSVTPIILMKPVKGAIVSVDRNYVAASDAHFAFALTDAQYRDVLAVVEKWRNAKQPSYELHSRNCVFFVGDVARALGLKVDDSDRKLMTRPRSYLINLIKLNPGVGTITPGGRAERALAAGGEAYRR